MFVVAEVDESVITRQLPRPIVIHPRDHLPARGPGRRAGLRREAGIDPDAATQLLQRARAHQQAAAAAEVGKLQTALAWARLHPAQPGHERPTRGREAAVDLGGEGAQPVAEFCLAELAACLGLSTDAGRRLVATALELADRLPQTWAEVLDGRVPAWRATRIADRTRDLSLAAAAFVDDQVHPIAGTLTLPLLEALITDVIALFDPERAAAEAAAAADHRGVWISRSAGTTDGLTSLCGLLDTPDADDLEHAIADLARQLHARHPEETLDRRRARAVGYLARGQQVEGTPTHGTGRRREVVIYAHLSQTAVATGDLVRVERGRQVVDAQRFRDWLDLPDAKLTVRPVIDLATEISCPGYVPSAELHEQVVVRDLTCVFPWCSRPARGCQLDHIEPYEADGSGGKTTSSNLACLCTYHHRLKTHTGWTYHRVDPRTYLWTSPHGRRYVRTRDGTSALE